MRSGSCRQPCPAVLFLIHLIFISSFACVSDPIVSVPLTEKDSEPLTPEQFFQKIIQFYSNQGQSYAQVARLPLIDEKLHILQIMSPSGALRSSVFWENKPIYTYQVGRQVVEDADARVSFLAFVASEYDHAHKLKLHGAISKILPLNTMLSEQAFSELPPELIDDIWCKFGAFLDSYIGEEGRLPKEFQVLIQELKSGSSSITVDHTTHSPQTIITKVRIKHGEQEKFFQENPTKTLIYDEYAVNTKTYFVERIEVGYLSKNGDRKQYNRKEFQPHKLKQLLTEDDYLLDLNKDYRMP